jgi:hypothetical protein
VGKPCGGASRSYWQGWTGASIGRTDGGFFRGAGGGAHPHGGDQVRRWGAPTYAQKNETVILVIFGYFYTKYSL